MIWEQASLSRWPRETRVLKSRLIGPLPVLAQIDLDRGGADSRWERVLVYPCKVAVNVMCLAKSSSALRKRGWQPEHPPCLPRFWSAVRTEPESSTVVVVLHM